MTQKEEKQQKTSENDYTQAGVAQRAIHREEVGNEGAETNSLKIDAPTLLLSCDADDTRDN